MKNWEKMQKGEVYDDFGKDLFDLRVQAKSLFREYNQTSDDQVDRRQVLLGQLFKSLGKSVWIEPNFRCEFGQNISIGDHVYINFECIILDCSPIQIGNNVLIGPRVGIYSGDHALLPEQRIKGACFGKPVTIEDNVWIGGDVQVLGGVSIGKGSVIGAGSVVTKSIPAGVVAAGNPCRVIREITPSDQVDFRP